MQASDKEALPLFGTLEGKEGGKASIATLRESPPLPGPGFPILEPAWEPGNPRSIRDGRAKALSLRRKCHKTRGPRRDKAIAEIKAGRNDS